MLPPHSPTRGFRADAAAKIAVASERPGSRGAQRRDVMQTMPGAISCRRWASAASRLTLASACAGRFDEKICIIRPDTKGRYDILKVAAPSRAPGPWPHAAASISCTGCQGVARASGLPAIAQPGLRGCLVRVRVCVIRLYLRGRRPMRRRPAQVHARTRPLADDVDLMQLARDLPGLSGAPRPLGPRPALIAARACAGRRLRVVSARRRHAPRGVLEIPF